MAEVGIRLGKGWKVFQQALDPSFNKPILRKHVGRATEANGKVMVRRIREYISAGIEPKNAPLTAAIKGGDKPIVGTPGADLFGSITSEKESWRVALVGVARAAYEEKANVARIVHDGMAIKVTAKMRGLFWVLWLASKGKIPPGNLRGRAKEIYDQTQGAKGIKPLSAATKVIVIPPRPYIRVPAEDQTNWVPLRENWKNAVQATFAEMAKKGV